MRADVREGGVWTPLQRAKNDVLFVILSALLRGGARLPPRMLVLLGHAAALIVWAIVPGLRGRAVVNVRRGLGLDAREARRFVRRNFEALGQVLGETIATFDPTRPLDVLPLLPGSRACLDEAVAEGRGVVFASAHLGPWERVAASLVAVGVPLTVVAREPYDPRLRWVYDHLRGTRNVPTVYRGATGAAFGLVRALRKGRVLAIPMDLATRARSVDVPFLGHPAPTPVGAARLANGTGAVVVVGTVAPAADGSLGISFVRIPPAGTEIALTACINEELSRRIRALPELWPWMHARWPTDPLLPHCSRAVGGRG